MDFSQLIFWRILFFSVVLMLIAQRVFKFIPAQKRHKLFLLVISWVMLGTISIETLLIFFSVCIGAFILCKLQIKYPIIPAKVTLGLAIPLLLLPLFYYKYSNFTLNIILGQDFELVRNLIIPVGISFYTFQVIAFCIDTLMNREAMPNFLNYMLFCSFFPQIVAGPIERKQNLLPQVENIQTGICPDNMKTGICYILLGIYFKSVLADNLAYYMTTDYNGQSAYVIWLNNLLFSLRIYFDFAGYGLSAWGLALCFNIKLTMNFWSPYTSTNVSEFWRRWHITLTTWFRDYIYFPMKGSRTRRWWLNILIIFLISGIWHGAGWNFLIWGMLIGITMIIHRLFSKRGYKLPSLPAWLLTTVTMIFIWMFFYVTDSTLLWQHLLCISDISHYQGNIPLTGNKTDAALGILLCFAILTIVLEWISLRKYNHPYQIFTHPAIIITLSALLIIAQTGKAPEFIYFAF